MVVRTISTKWLKPRNRSQKYSIENLQMNLLKWLYFGINSVSLVQWISAKHISKICWIRGGCSYILDQQTCIVDSSKRRLLAPHTYFEQIEILLEKYVYARGVKWNFDVEVSGYVLCWKYYTKLMCPVWNHIKILIILQYYIMISVYT